MGLYILAKGTYSELKVWVDFRFLMLKLFMLIKAAFNQSNSENSNTGKYYYNLK